MTNPRASNDNSSVFLSLVIPAYNEKDRLVTNVATVKAYLDSPTAAKGQLTVKCDGQTVVVPARAVRRAAVVAVRAAVVPVPAAARQARPLRATPEDRAGVAARLALARGRHRWPFHQCFLFSLFSLAWPAVRQKNVTGYRVYRQLTKDAGPEWNAEWEAPFHLDPARWHLASKDLIRDCSFVDDSIPGPVLDEIRHIPNIVYAKLARV